MNGRTLDEKSKQLLELILENKTNPEKISILLKSELAAVEDLREYEDRVTGVLVELGKLSDVATAKVVINSDISMQEEHRIPEMLEQSEEDHYSALIYGLALNRHVEAIAGLCAENKNSLLTGIAALGYAQGGYVELVDNMLAAGEIDAEYAENVYREGGFIKQADTLKEDIRKNALMKRLAFKLELFKTLETEGYFKPEARRPENIRQMIACHDRILEICAKAPAGIDLSEGGTKIFNFHHSPFDHMNEEYNAVKKLAERYQLDAERAFKFKVLKDLVKKELNFVRWGFRKGNEKSLADVRDQIDKPFLLKMAGKVFFTEQDVESVLPAFAAKLTSSATKQTLANFRAGLFKSPREFSDALSEIPHLYERKFGL